MTPTHSVQTIVTQRHYRRGASVARALRAAPARIFRRATLLAVAAAAVASVVIPGGSAVHAAEPAPVGDQLTISAQPPSGTDGWLNGWDLEYIAAYVSASPAKGLLPFYQLWSPTEVDHFYTTSNEERLFAHTVGYRDAGIDGYISPVRTGVFSEKFYRLWSAAGGDHFYTTSYDEMLFAQTVGYADQGIAGYVSPVANTGLTPLYRFWALDGIDHYYSTNILGAGPQYNGQQAAPSFVCGNLQGVAGYASTVARRGWTPVVINGLQIGFMSASKGPGLIPVYRYLGGVYSTNPALSGFARAGVIGYVAAAPAAGLVPVFVWDTQCIR